MCENNLEFTNTPHTPMKRDGVLFITQRRQVTLISWHWSEGGEGVENVVKEVEKVVKEVEKVVKEMQELIILSFSNQIYRQQVIYERTLW